MAFIEHKNVVSSDGKRVMTLQQFKLWLKTSFDKDGDGRLSKSELREAFRLTAGLFATWKSDRALRHADADHDGFIDENEYGNLAKFVEKHLNVRITK